MCGGVVERPALEDPELAAILLPNTCRRFDVREPGVATATHGFCQVVYA